ncbi:MAG: HipA domain-containing protein, partial [Corynebacterium sp.]|uniref:HipA domain-containing protein n=1 Tax=Corynebacterium sp. TaxID=1720 RepID=UPI003F0BC367
MSRSGDLRPVDNSEIGDMLRRAMADLPVSSEAVPDGKFSLAGVQAKIALRKDGSVWSSPHGASPSTHILKPANPGMEDQDLVEAVTMGTARRLGLSAAHVDVSEFDGLRCLVVERYDRARLPDGRWVRVHQEDMCQATGTPPFRKYESQRGRGAREVAELIENVSSNADEDTRRFVQALIFNWLICGTDAHARNYSVVLHGGNVRLAPLYDANSHLAYTDGGSSDLSMGIDGIFRVSLLTRRRWVDEAMHLHVDPDWMVTEIDRQMARLIDSMHAAADVDSVSRYGSSVVTPDPVNNRVSVAAASVGNR